MTDPHHNAAQGYQRRGRKTELFGSQKRCDHNVAAGLQLAVRFHRNAAAQVIEHQRLVGLCETKLPRQAGVLDAGLRRSAGSAVVTADQDDVRVALGHTRGNRAHPYLRDQLDADAGVVVSVFQVVNQLGQVLDRVNIMVRRWRDQTDAGRRIAHLGDPWIDLPSGQLAPFTRLGPLGHLDLQLFCLSEVIAGHAEPARGHLFDRAVARIPIGVGNVTRRILTSLARVALAADAVHGDGEGFMRFLADGTVRHRAGLEAFDDRFHRFHFLDGNGLGRELQPHEASQGRHPFRLIVDQFCVLFECGVIVVAARLLQEVDRFGVKQMQFPI